MADQATLRPAARAEINGGARVAIDSPLTEGVLGNLTEFASDCTTLAELQARLALIDLKASAAAAAVPVIGTVVGAVLGLASVPVLLLAAGELLAQYSGLTAGWSYLIVAGVGLALAGVLAWLFGTRIGAAFGSFRRSQEELARNVSWIKTVLAHSGRRPAHHRRSEGGK